MTKQNSVSGEFDAESYLAVARARHESIATRLVSGAALGVFCAVFTGETLVSALWFALVLISQGADMVALGAMLRAAPEQLKARARVMTITTAISALVWSSALALLWVLGGPYGRVVAMLSCAGSMLHVAVVCHHSPRLFWLMISPYAAVLVGPVVIFSLVRGEIPLLMGLGLLVAVIGFIVNFFASYKQLRAMTGRVERALAEAEMRRAEAERANAAKSDFLATMSHELRTPLNAVIGYSEMLEEDLDADGRSEGAQDARRIGQAGRHLLSLINNVLDLSKIEAGRYEVALAATDIDHIVREVTSTLEHATRGNGNRLFVESEPVGVCVTDGLLLKQCLFNLLSNANKFTRDGLVGLRVRRRGSDLRFEVSDTGIGMRPEQIENLFQPFVQADASVSRKYGGTGLGLVITRRIARMLGGDVQVRSAPGEGSVFTLCIAAKEPSYDEACAEAAA